MIGALIWIGVMGFFLFLCLAPACLAMAMTIQLLTARYEQARAARTSRAGLNAIVVSVGAAVGIATFVTHESLIAMFFAAPVFGVAALVLSRRNARRTMTWPQLPVARAR